MANNNAFSKKIGSTSTNFSYKFYYCTTLLLATVGLLNSIYLSWLHYKNYTDIVFTSFCALSNSFNCDTVSQSPWSIFIGLPLSYWGCYSYLLFIGILLSIHRQSIDFELSWHPLLILSTIYAAVSIFFGYISATKISSYCILCLINQAICLSIFFINFIVVKRYYKHSIIHDIRIFYFKPWPLPLKLILFIIIFLTILTEIYLPKYWLFKTTNHTNFLKTGITTDGHPWIGTDNPKITIHEYTDYLCFQCSKMHIFIRNLIAANPGKVKLVHHNYPLDHEVNNIIAPRPFHIGSGKMAMIAIYSMFNNKFWEMNDALYASARTKQILSTRILSESTGLPMNEIAYAAESSQIKEILLQDIRTGLQLHITGTPTYVINGNVYVGSIPKDILNLITQ